MRGLNEDVFFFSEILNRAKPKLYSKVSCKRKLLHKFQIKEINFFV